MSNTTARPPARPGSTAAAAPAAPAREVLPQRRLRAAMAVVAVLMGLLAWVQSGQIRHAEQVRGADAEMAALATAQAALGQQIGLIAAAGATAVVGPQLKPAVQRMQREAAQLDALLSAQQTLGARPSAALVTAVGQWRQARSSLWQQAQTHTTRTTQTPRTTATAPSAPIQAAAAAAELAGNAFAAQLQAAALQRSAQAAQQAQVWLAATLLALLLVAALVVEPAARALQGQQHHLAAQTEALERLATVAERTSNIVIMADREFRIVWANAAFERVTGYALAEALGRQPGELMYCERTDPAVAAALGAAMREGRSLRVEMLNRTKAGRDYWVDVDAQPVHDAAGAVTGYTSVHTVITEQVHQRLQMEALLAALPTGVVLQDSAGRIVECNPAAQKLLHLSRDELLGRASTDPRWKALRDDLSDYPGAEHPAMRTLATGLPLSAESMALRTPDGTLYWLLVNTQPIAHAAGQGVVSCFVDVTEQRTQQQLLQLTVEGSGLGVWQWDIRSGAMTCNDRALRMFGYAPGDLAMTREAWVELVHPEDRAQWVAGMTTHLAGAAQPYRCEVRVRRADGGWMPIMSTGTVVERSERGTPRRMAGIHIDLTEQVRLQEVLRRNARTDALTQLPNRTVVLERVQAALERWRNRSGEQSGKEGGKQSGSAESFAVLFMDFDRFKQVNDTLGHAAGDELLRQIAQRLQGALRSGDSVARTAAPEQTAARIGGDEFVIVLEKIHGTEDACAVAQRLLELLARPYTIDNTTLHSSASIGIVTAEHAAADADSVLRDADTAMYEAKRSGRGRWVLFDTAMHERVARQVRMESDLRAGLDRGELFVVYQPVVDLTTGRTCGVEALARWQHPVRGLVPPVEFIPVAEESGLIGAVGEFVLGAACAQFMQWQALFDPMALLAVNLSRAQLRLPGLVDTVRHTLLRCGLAPARLQLEVTESLAAQDERVQTTLRELKALGVKLALDDFGTGYSSLACLHLLPVDTVKIDRSFVRDAEHSEYHRVLIEATIRVAQTLGMAVVAEGIETPGQALLLHALRCDKGQGYLYGKPMLPADIAVAMARERPGTPVLAAA